MCSRPARRVSDVPRGRGSVYHALQVSHSGSDPTGSGSQTLLIQRMRHAGAVVTPGGTVHGACAASPETMRAINRRPSASALARPGLPLCCRSPHA